MDTTEIEVFAGLETTVNDPLLVRRGAHLGGAVRPLPWAGVVATVGAYPSLGTTDWTPLTRVLVEQNQIVPDLSRLVSQGAVFAELTPIRTRSEPVSAALHLGLGAGYAYTVDDLEMVQLEGSPIAERHERELHPTVAWSVSADALRGPVGLRLRYSETRYTENVAGDEQRRWPIWLGVDVVVSLEGLTSP